MVLSCTFGAALESNNIFKLFKETLTSVRIIQSGRISMKIQASILFKNAFLPAFFVLFSILTSNLNNFVNKFFKKKNEGWRSDAAD